MKDKQKTPFHAGFYKINMTCLPPCGVVSNVTSNPTPSILSSAEKSLVEVRSDGPINPNCSAVSVKSVCLFYKA
ncbi:hypothetical protein [Sporosarcina sp. PTS2304]|uniref:hypothetical protein n=1 Tax=Sporosarcina sp. PTS2304 TaxID=2283194 RepID=UPI0013B35AFC|nr:hypothetical protein [Sporosarcina sp. PTS2304]